MTMQATKNRRPRKAHWLPALMIAGALLMPGWNRRMRNRAPSSTPALTN